MQNNYNILIDKLDAFIKKYYTNLLIKGALYSVALLGSFFLIFTLFESMIWFSTTIRSIIFYSYILMGLWVIIRYVINPTLKLYKIGPRLSHEMAANVIGKHFSDVQDTLLNTLQLNQLLTEKPENYDLIIAGINKKSEKLMKVPFKSAVDYSSNRRYLYLALPPLLIICGLLVASPNILTDPGKRLINHSVAFEKPLPFKLTIVNNSLTAVQQEDFTLRISVSGKELPAEVFLVMDGVEFRMQTEDKLNYSYTFRKIQKDLDFKLLAAGYYSDNYEIVVIPKPIILNYGIELKYPEYLNKKSEFISNIGDINVPQGTILNWKFYTRDTKTVLFRLGEKLIKLSSGMSNTFSTSHKLMKDINISINSQNKYLTNTDSLLFFAQAIPDLYPTIAVEQFHDSIYDNKLYFRGLIRDDYGFRNLQFRLARVHNGKPGVEMSVEVPLQTNANEQNFYYYYDLLTLGLDPGEELSYYFEVWDNDGVNGSKSAKSQAMTFRIPTLDEVNKMVDKHQKNLINDFNSSIKEAKDIKKQIEKLNENLINKKELNYRDKKQIEDLLQRHQNLQNKIEKMQLENKQMNTKESQIKEVNQEIIEKQKQLEKLFDEIMSDEMKKMFEELQKMMDNMDKDKIKDVLEKMKTQTEDLEKDLDRNLELFKQLDFDKKLTESIENLKKLADEEKKLSEETSNSSKKENDKLGQKQEEIKKEFDEISKSLEDLKKIDQQLEEPNNFKVPTDQKQEAESEMKESSKSLKESQMKKASDHQKKASDKMQQMSDALFEMQMEMQQEELAEDKDALRAILENLINISFDQEDLMGRIKGMNRSDPKLNAAIEEQKKISDNLTMVEDSLLALSKRQVMIESFVNREIRNINDNTDLAMQAMQNRSISMATSKQQYVMTSVNNLALLLSESLKNMEQNMAMKASGKSGKNKPMPGQGKGSMKSMRQMQEKLNQQMEQLRQGMKPDKGELGKTGQGSVSEQLAKMAAQQEALRKMLQDYSNELQKEGNVNQPGLNKMIQEMEKTETELVNKILNKQTMERQAEILTRLLESEKAEMKREQEERRESNEGKDVPKPDPAKYFDSIGLPSKETELIHTIPPSFRTYYRNKVNSYFIQIPTNK